MAIGSVCLVLHGHVPYVLRHGLWPHGEDWLYEAAAETYLPLLAMLDECIFLKARPRMTIGLTPVLLEQLAHDDFKQGLVRYFQDRLERAGSDQREFASLGNGQMVQLAEMWKSWYGMRAKQFEDLSRDIPGAFAKHAAAGNIEILTSCATHGFLPLLYEDSSVRAQIRAGSASSRRILGFQPRGFWLPECAYRRGGPWSSPNGWAGKGNRLAIERMVADESMTHFFVEHGLAERANSEYVKQDGHWRKTDWQEAVKYASRGWRSVNEPMGLNSDGDGPGRLTAFARDQKVCEQVWSGWIGYPANGDYLEFHKKWGPKRGLRYWKVTGKGVDLGGKHLYVPEAIPGRIFEHARHFCDYVKGQLRHHRDRTGRHGVAVAAFDAELFGHWWFEGLQFLRDVVLTLSADSEIELATTEGFMQAHPIDKTVSMPDGSWGEGGDFRVWANDRINWMWDIEYRCEALFGKMTFELPWRNRPDLREIMEKAARELLLLQSSDWLFMISRAQAVDYGTKRFMEHVSRLENLCDIAEKLVGDVGYLGKLTEVERHDIQSADVHDVIFPGVDLNWWNM